MPTSLKYNKGPLQEITGHPVLEKADISLTVKREDLNNETVSGNKWWKLKLNLDEAINTGHHSILTFGGAYSNHLYATAAACAKLGLRAIGVVRGERTTPLNATLQFAEEQGMHLHFVSRSGYREKNLAVFHKNLFSTFGSFYLLPEGGSNLLAVQGCSLFASGELINLSYDQIYLPVGTGGTMAGVICGLKDSVKVAGVSVLKNGGFLEDEIQNFAYQCSGHAYTNWSLLTSYHHGGYARTTPELLNFLKEMDEVYGLPLDHVYTGKLLWAIFKEIEAGHLSRGTKVLAIHTGGLQGRLRVT